MAFSSQITATPAPGGGLPAGHISVNDKWRGSELLKTLQGSLNVLMDDQLGIVDFHPASDVGIVYVSEGDLAAGTLYKRKLVKLRKAERLRGVVIVEKTHISCQYFQTLQKFAVLELGLTLMPVINQTEAANLLVQMVHTENNPAHNVLHKSKKHKSVDASVLATVQCIPRLGEVKAKHLLEKFGSIHNINKATMQELSDVIGKNLGQTVWKFLHEKLT